MRQWVLADSSRQGLVRFALIDDETWIIKWPEFYDSADHPTFTDAVLTYCRAVQADPRHCGCVLSVAGPPVSDIVVIARSRWTISRTGLKSVFDGGADVVNDVAALGWSLLSASGVKLDPLAGQALHFDRPGRWVVVTLDDGVGAAVLSMDDDRSATVAACEPGHMAFAPSNGAECVALAELLRQRPHVSWEHVLSESNPLVPNQLAWSETAGEFVGNLVLATGAWSGVILTGRHAAKLRLPDAMSRFHNRLADRPKYGRYVAAVSCSLLASPDPLIGCAEFLRRTLGGCDDVAQ